MATSAPLLATQRLMNYSVELRNRSASRRGSPIYSANPFTPCRRLYSGGSRDCLRRCLHRGCCLRQIYTGSAATNPTRSESVGCVTKLQHSLNATAWRCCLPCSVRTFTTELAWAGSPRNPTSAMTGWLIVIYHRRTFTGWTGSLMGCEQKTQKDARREARKPARGGVGADMAYFLIANLAAPKFTRSPCSIRAARR